MQIKKKSDMSSFFVCDTVHTYIGLEIRYMYKVRVQAHPVLTIKTRETGICTNF